MRGATPLGRIFRQARRFATATSGIAAVEFALIVPVMLVMYLGMSELSRAISNSRRVTLLARTLADLTSRGDVVTMNDIFAAGGIVLAPFDASGARMVVSAAGVYGSGASAVGKVCSSKASGTGATALAPKAVIDVPAGFQADGMRFLRADVTMDYTPMLGSNIMQYFTGNGSSSITFSEQTPWPVRSGNTYNSTYEEIVLPGGSPCPK